MIIKRKNVLANHFIVGPLPEVDHDTPPEIITLVDDLHESTRIHKINNILRLRNNARQLSAQRLHLLPQVKIVGDLVLLVEFDRIVVLLAFAQLFAQRRYIRVILKLKERPLQHKLGINALHTQQIEHHVVGQVKGAVQAVRLAFDNVFSRARTHPLVDHEYDNTFIVETATTCASTHLYILARSDPAGLFAVPFAA